MGDFVGQNGSQFRLALRQTDRPGIDHNVPTRKRLRINRRIIEHVKSKGLLTSAAVGQVLPQSVDILVKAPLIPWRTCGKDPTDHGITLLGGFKHGLRTATNSTWQHCIP